MIDQIRGVLLRKEITGIVIDLGGMAFAVAVPLGTFDKLGVVGNSVTLKTYLHVREDALELFGFSTVDERDLFIRLLKVNSVGPKLALAILSRFSPRELAQVVMDRDVKRLTTVSGIGAKTAERLLVDLKDRLKVTGAASADFTGGGELSITAEAIRALEVLGFTTAQADNAVRRAGKSQGDTASVEDLVKKALKGE